MHLHPNSDEAYLDTSILDFGLKIDGFGVCCFQQEASVAGLLPWDDFDMQLSAFIDVADYRFDNDISGNIPTSKKVVGLSAEMHVVIETGLFDLLNQVRAR